MNEYIDITRKILDNNFRGAIVGNKSDLFKEEEVPQDEAREFAKKNEFKFTLVSAKEDINSFINLLKECVEDSLTKNS